MYTKKAPALEVTLNALWLVLLIYSLQFCSAFLPVAELAFTMTRSLSFLQL